MSLDNMTEIHKKLKGGATILAVIGIAISVVAPIAGVFWYSIGAVTDKAAAQGERISKIEEAVETIKKDNAETRKDIKDFLIQLNTSKRK